MYQKEFFAPTREEAVAMASKHFNVEAAKLEVAELPGSVAVVGMGERKCFVVSVAGTADQLPPDRGDRDRPPRGRDREGRGGDRRGGGRGRSDRGDRGGDRGGGRGGDRGGGRGERRERGGPGGGRDRPRAPRGDRPEGVDHEKLEAIARDAAERVKKSGVPETLEWMNSKERWVVHNYLRDVEGVTSVSEGEGSDKRLKIIPE